MGPPREAADSGSGASASTFSRLGAGLQMTIAKRLSPAGVHLFDRLTGLNVLLDEVEVPDDHFSAAPRYLSAAITNACELRCVYCYAPKHAAVLDVDQVVDWAVELDGSGCLGIGFGGGEPTSHPRFVELCQRVTASTAMAVTFTTHGHRLTPTLAAQLRGSVHFARLSVDGVGTTYERLRGRPFGSVHAAAKLLTSVCPFGINTVVNADTLRELDDVAAFAVQVGAVELLLLPQQPTLTRTGLSLPDADVLVDWVRQARPGLRMAIARSGLEAFVPAVELFQGEHPLDAYMHIDAAGVLRPNAYASTGIQIDGSVLEAVYALREAA